MSQVFEFLALIDVELPTNRAFNEGGSPSKGLLLRCSNNWFIFFAAENAKLRDLGIIEAP